MGTTREQILEAVPNKAATVRPLPPISQTIEEDENDKREITGDIRTNS